MKMRTAVLAATLVSMFGSSSVYALIAANGVTLKLAGINETASIASSEQLSVNLNSVTVENVKLPD